MSAARPTWWCPNIPGLKKIVTGRRSLAPDSTAKRSSTRCSSSANSGVTSACSGGETTRLAAPDRTGTRTSSEPAAARGDIAIRGVIPIPAGDPSADAVNRVPGRFHVTHVPNDKFNRSVFVEPNGHWKAAKAPGIHDMLEVDIGIKGPAVHLDQPLQPRGINQRQAPPESVPDKLREVFEDPTVLRLQFEARQEHFSAS